MRLPWRPRDGRCATCGHLGIRHQERLVSADLAYRVTAKSRLHPVAWNSAWCQREATNIADEARLVWLARGGLREWEQLGVISVPQAQPEDFLVVVTRERHCPQWVQWAPGKSLEGHMESNAIVIAGLVITAVGVLVAAIGLWR